MIKKLLVLFLLLTGAGFVQAQTVKVSLGMKGQGEFILPNTEVAPELYGMLGGGGGLFVDMTVARVVGLQVEGLYSYTMGNFTDPVRNTRTSVQHHYLHIPVVLQLWCGRTFAFEVGYQQSIALMGTVDSNMFPYPAEDRGMLDYGSLVAGININMGRVVFLNLRYCHALTNSYVMTKYPSKNQGLQVSLGFRFFTSKKSVFKR